MNTGECIEIRINRIHLLLEPPTMKSMGKSGVMIIFFVIKLLIIVFFIVFMTKENAGKC